MQRFPSSAVLIAALLCALPARVAAVDLSCSLDVDEPGHLSVTWSARREGVILLVGAGDRDSFIPRTAVTLPCGAAGPLSFAGVLRALQEPLSLSPGSDAYDERPGLVVAADRLKDAPGFCAAPFPGNLGAWWVPTDQGPGLVGGFASVGAGGPVVVDAAAQLAEPGTTVSQGWYLDRPRWPGGLLGNAAARVLLSFPEADVTGTAGVSVAELAGCGGFGEIRALVRSRSVQAAAVAGAVTSGYWLPAGKVPADLARLGADVTLGAGPGRLRLQGSAAYGRAPFVPGSVIPEKEEWSLTAERAVRIRSGVSGSVVLEGSKSVEYRASSARLEDAAAAATVGVESDALAVSAEVSWSAGDGIAILARARWDMSRLVSLAMEGGSTGGQASCRVKGGERDREMTVRVAVQDGAFSLGLSWSASGESRSPPDP